MKYLRTKTTTARATAKLGIDSLEPRLTPYSASGNLWPMPALITVSFVPDGTLVNGYASNLFNKFNTKFGFIKQATTTQPKQGWANKKFEGYNG